MGHATRRMAATIMEVIKMKAKCMHLHIFIYLFNYASEALEDNIIIFIVT